MNYSYQQQIDHQHLRLLGLFHYILAGLYFLGACLCVAYVVFMVWAMSGGLPGTGSTSPDDTQALFLMLAIVYGAFALLALATAVANIFAGIFMNRRKNKLFLLIVAGVNVLNIPLGTILAVFSFIVLLRPSVSAEFAAMANSPAPPAPPAPPASPAPPSPPDA